MQEMYKPHAHHIGDVYCLFNRMFRIRAMDMNVEVANIRK